MFGDPFDGARLNPLHLAAEHDFWINYWHLLDVLASYET